MARNNPRSNQQNINRTSKQNIKKNSVREIGSNSFFNLLVDELQDLLSAENQIIAVLPGMARAATSSELKTALLEHLKETRQQVIRLNKIFQILGIRPQSKFCEGMEGLINEAHEEVSQQTQTATRDAAIIAAAQKVEHYEIAAYGTARAHAKQLNMNKVASLLDDTLDEEAAADRKLTRIAEGGFFTAGINEIAVSEESYVSR